MTQYLLSVWHDDTYEVDFSTEEAQRLDAQVSAVNEEMQARGAWVFANGLQPASSATVLRATDGDVSMTDGPYAESKEQMEFKSTWLGNKAIYRTRMAVADGGELLVLAPGVKAFGEDAGIDRLIRRHGYHGTPRTLSAVKEDPELADSLSAAAHLIHGSSEGRFRIRYAAGGLDAATIEKAGYESADLDASLRRYDPAKLADGFNLMPDGERIYFVSNPALGLWSLRDKLKD
jgi:hypothetical protein